MKGHILGHRVALPEGAQHALASGELVHDPKLLLPARPAAVSASAWRRMTRLARLLTSQVLDLQAEHPDLSWTQLPLVWGTAMGEVAPSTSFLDRILTNDDGRGSPTAFQNSVYNSTPGHVSMVLGMRGLSETVCAGQVSGLAALHRGLSLLRSHEAVLVAVGEDLCPPIQRSWSHAAGPAGEAVVSVLLSRGEGLEVRWGLESVEAPVLCRQVPMAWETAPLPHADLVPERVCGHSSAAGLATWLTLGKGTLVEVDGLTALTAWRR